MQQNLADLLSNQVLNFKKGLYLININSFTSPQFFANKCQELIEHNRYEMFKILNDYFLNSYTQSFQQYFLEEYMASLQYHSECQLLMEDYVHKALLGLPPTV